MAKYNQFGSIFGQLRRCWSRHPRKREILQRAKHPALKGPRGGPRYICESCGKTTPSSKVNVDHIDPVVPIHRLSKDMTWDEIVDRMFNCPSDNLQVLCLDCHKEKTQEENKKRRDFKMAQADPACIAAEITAEYKRQFLKMEHPSIENLIAQRLEEFIKKQEEAPLCPEHKRYKGAKKPTNSCEACWRFYLGRKDAS